MRVKSFIIIRKRNYAINFCVNWK